MVYVIIQLTNAVPTLSHRTILEKQHSFKAVSYTHLDVYKRQAREAPGEQGEVPRKRDDSKDDKSDPWHPQDGR